MQRKSIKATNPLNPINLIATYPVILHWLQSEGSTSKERPVEQARSVKQVYERYMQGKFGSLRTREGPSVRRFLTETQRCPRPLRWPIRETFGSHLDLGGGGGGGVKTTWSSIEHNCRSPPILHTQIHSRLLRRSQCRSRGQAAMFVNASRWWTLERLWRERRGRRENYIWIFPVPVRSVMRKPAWGVNIDVPFDVKMTFRGQLCC